MEHLLRYKGLCAELKERLEDVELALEGERSRLRRSRLVVEKCAAAQRRFDVSEGRMAETVARLGQQLLLQGVSVKHLQMNTPLTSSTDAAATALPPSPHPHTASFAPSTPLLSLTTAERAALRILMEEEEEERRGAFEMGAALVPPAAAGTSSAPSVSQLPPPTSASVPPPRSPSPSSPQPSPPSARTKWRFLSLFSSADSRAAVPASPPPQAPHSAETVEPSPTATATSAPPHHSGAAVTTAS